MTKIIRTLRNKRQRIVYTILLIFVAITGKKLYDYAAPPTKDKDCDFVYPANSNGTKQIRITVKVPPTLAFKQAGGFVNDASCLNKTGVYGVVKISTVDEVQTSLKFARENNIKVTSAGQQHSMGGQSFNAGGLILDMKGFNQMTLDKTNKTLRVDSGATWEQIQRYLDAEGLSVKAMQSINIFTVGGTLSVNAHGLAHNPGQVAPTVRALRVMLYNGEIKTASPTENPELFRSVLGGYGLFGVILDANLDVVDNEMYAWKTATMNYKEFPDYYKSKIHGQTNIGLMYARISLSPVSYLTETIVNQYEKVDYSDAIPPLTPTTHNWLNRLVINFSKTGGLGRFVRWTLEKYGGKSLHECLSRNKAMSDKEVCLVSRNEEMYDAMGYLKNKLADTDILQEYFIPQDKMVEFIDGLRSIVKANKANLLNTTIRIVTKDTVTALPYATEDRFAFVLYFNQKLNEKESKILQKTTTDLIDLATGLGGRFYLPYQLYYSQAQLKKAYPEIDTFFHAKRKYDPTELFTNTFYNKYGKGI